MKKSIKISLALIFILSSLSSCSLAYRVLLGIDSSPAWITDKKLLKRAKKHDIPLEYNLVMDTVSYSHDLGRFYKDLIEGSDFTKNDSTEYSSVINVYKDDSQPVHFRLFDKTGTEVFKIVNCYVDPPIPMNWNVDGCFDTFPPQIAIETLNKHNLEIDFFLSRASTMDDKKLSLEDLPATDYYGIVIWNDFFKRPSRKLIKTVQKYVENSDQSVTLLYINNQNAYIWDLMDMETKEKVALLYEQEAQKVQKKELKDKKKKEKN